MKVCPFCAEEIQDAAIKCKHCGSNLPEATKGSDADDPQAEGAAAFGIALVLIVIGLAAYFIPPMLSPKGETGVMVIVDGKPGYVSMNKVDSAINDVFRWIAYGTWAAAGWFMIQSLMQLASLGSRPRLELSWDEFREQYEADRTAGLDEVPPARSESADPLFCHHCGMALDEPLAKCPACAQDLT